MILGRRNGHGALMGLRRTTSAWAITLALVGAGLPSLAFAQASMNDLIARKTQGGKDGKEKPRLLVEGQEIVYNRDKNTVAASGNVELNYDGRTLQADRVIYDRTTGRVIATGNVRMTEANGQVTTGDRFELTDDFKTGFIDSLRAEQTSRDRLGPYTTRFSAPRGERIGGESTTFEYGTYTACEPCREHPEKPPLWQVKAARIVHNNEEHRIYYENATVEVGGVPIGWVPYFWSPDPTVRRESGFLAPRYIHTKALGYGASIPYFWAISPDKDLTISPSILSRQGVLMQAEYRQRFLTGEFNIRAAGIFQQGESAFIKAPYGPANREARGSIESTGRFNINEHWRYGWDVALLSDKWFLQNYKIRSESFSANYILPESTSSAYLRGQGDRSYFDLSAYYFQGLSYADWQKQLPGVTPVLDYDKRINGPQPLGGELRFQFNFTDVNRQLTQYTPSSVYNSSLGGIPTLGLLSTLPPVPYDSCVVFQRGVCIVSGLAGNFARASAEVSWRRNIIDDMGQVWTPFAYLRTDGFLNSPDLSGYQNQAVTNFIRGNEQFVGRIMPAVGLEYRYPFVADGGQWGTHTITPIGQVVARPNEGHLGRLPNEDAHSLVYDDSNLFSWDKFSGYDRVEGGVRANVGLQYNVVTPTGWTGSALFGQSYHLVGQNSFAGRDLLNTGADSGLDSRASDYVGRIQLNPSENFSLITRGRFDQRDFAVNAFETQAVANFKPFLPIMASLTYARYAAQPEQGYPYRREGLRPGASWQITPNWSVGGSVLFDLDRYLEVRDANALTLAQYAAAFPSNPAYAASLASLSYRKSDPYTVAQTNLAVTYRDECTMFSVNYMVTPRLAATGLRETDRTILVRLELRSLGQSNVSQNITTTTADGIATR